ncbi:hypothetical protein AGLY_012043 [Aphis glycines]|uniref:Uncharacterized protein n=1 Tax=Aphis glycines TaxID=307491 RepID=A0A6G0TAP4_APHGL|nr:hypothetical protein AGLY_012043 [Aphis glycines]
MSNDIGMQYLEDQVYKYTENKYCWHHILVVGINFTQYDTILDCADGVSHTTVASQEPEDCGRTEYKRRTGNASLESPQVLPDETGYMSQRGHSYHPIRTAWVMSRDSLKTINNYEHFESVIIVVVVIVVVVVDEVHWPPRDRQHINNNNNYQSAAYCCDPRYVGHGCLYDCLTFYPADRRRA